MRSGECGIGDKETRGQGDGGKRGGSGEQAGGSEQRGEALLRTVTSPFASSAAVAARPCAR